MNTNGLKLLLLDMDGTLTTVTSPWQYVHEKLGIWERHGKPLLEAFMARELGFVEFCDRDTQLWNDREVELEEVQGILDTIPVPNETVEFLKSARDAGVQLAIISTGFTRTADRIRAMAGLSENELFVAANELRQESDGSIKAVLRVGDGFEIPGKAFWASHVLHLYGATKEVTGAVGDTSSDRPLFQSAGVWTQIKAPAELPSLPWLPFRK